VLRDSWGIWRNDLTQVDPDKLRRRDAAIVAKRTWPRATKPRFAKSWSGDPRPASRAILKPIYILYTNSPRLSDVFLVCS
jgi:hypothetical protein